MDDPNMGAEPAAAGQTELPVSDGTARTAPGAASSELVPREQRLFLALAVIIGLFAGLGVVCFRMGIEWAHLALLGSAMTPSWPRVVLAPALTGLLIGILVFHVFKGVGGSGVNQTKAAVYIYDGYIPFKTVVGKFITSALSIGSGQSLGPEDPSLQIGAGLASVFGRLMRLSRDRIRMIAPVGAAAGLAAAFNAPITAVLFVIEEVIGTWTAGVLGAVVLSAIASVAVERWFLGNEPLFRIPPYEMHHPAELLAYVVLGVVGALASLLYVKLLAVLRPAAKRLPAWSCVLHPALGGLIIGFIGLQLPQIMGAGYPFIDQAMHGQYTWRLLAILGVVKIFATVLSFSSSAPGGMFAPTLFMGAMLGASVGSLLRVLFPWLSPQIGAYALVGMGTMFAGALRAPMTSIFMILEVSGNYSIIVPVMVSNTISYFIARRYQKVPVFDLLSRQEGTELPSMEELREEKTLRVENAMHPPGLVLTLSETAGQALKLAENTEQRAFLVKLGPGKWYFMALEDLREHAAGNEDTPLSSIVPDKRLPYLYPDQPLDFALRQMGDLPVVPVVHRASHELEGAIGLPDVLAAYRRAPHS